jgi:hypothetical protein
MAKVSRKGRPSPAQLSNPVMSVRLTPEQAQYVRNALQRAGVGFRQFVLEAVALGEVSFQRGLQVGLDQSRGLVNPVVDIECEGCGQLVARVNLWDPRVWGVVRTALASRYHPACYRAQVGRSAPGKHP